MLRFAYETAHSLDDAVSLLARLGPGARLLAGGTDLLPQIKEHVVEPATVIALGRIPEMETLDLGPDGGLRIGAMVRMRRIERSPLVLERYRAVAEGAKLVGSVQIRNLATLGGNICNAAPSADAVPALIAFGGEAITIGPNGGRVMPLEKFFLGPRRTVLELGELLAEVHLPAPPPRTGSCYLRHTPRMEMDIAVAGSGAVITLDGGRIADARICLASVAPTPVRAPSAEAILRGARPDEETITRAAAAAAGDCSPISDVRGSDDYRRHLVTTLTERALRAAIARARGEESNENTDRRGHGDKQ
jgi:CO/xanthine dehydrogenase FAD-binding subunit